jgi:hypothetical protein
MFSPVRRDVFRWGTPDPEGDWIMFGHLFVRDSEIILIDPPLIPGLIESISRIGKPKTIILTTQNHTRGSRHIREKTGATVYVPDQNPNAVEPGTRSLLRKLANSRSTARASCSASRFSRISMTLPYLRTIRRS